METEAAESAGLGASPSHYSNGSLFVVLKTIALRLLSRLSSRLLFELPVPAAHGALVPVCGQPLLNTLQVKATKNAQRHRQLSCHVGGES
jgi:hypothetical protein